MSDTLDISKLNKVKEELKKAGFSKADWKDLGENLGLHPNTLKEINLNEGGNVNRCFTECLAKWLRKADNVGNPSWTTLADALGKMDECANETKYIRDLAQKGDAGKMEEKNAKRPKIDATKKSSKEGGAQASASDEEPDGGTAQKGESSLSKDNKKQNSLSSFMCNGWIILPLCFAAAAVVLMIYLPSYLQMKGKEGEPNSHVHVHPEDVKPSQVPLPTTASKPLDISDLSDIISKLKDFKFDRSRWKDLCLNIGLYEVTINTIRSDEDNVSDRLRSCLVKWLNRVEDVDKKGGATWESLENGLINIGQKPVAEKLRERRKNRNK